MASLGDDNSKALQKYNVEKTGNGYKLNLNYGNLGNKLDFAQYVLDTQVWIDVKKYMPIDTGHLIALTNALNAVTRKKVYMFPPSSDYGHYQYEGVVYVDPKYGVAGWYDEQDARWWSRKGVTKIPSAKRLSYSNPMATSHWGQTAIDNHMDEWVEVVKRAIGK